VIRSPHIGLRNTDHLVGLLVVLAVIAFLGAVLHAGLLCTRDC
jgi:hypothetical protein